MSPSQDIKSSEIKQYSKEDFTIAFSEVQIGNHETKELSSKIRDLISTIIDLTVELNLNSQAVNLQEQILYRLETSDNINHIGIGKLVSDIINGEKILCLTNHGCQNDFETEKYSNEVSFVWDIKEGWKVLRVSNNVKEILGYDNKLFREGKVNFSEIIHPYDLERVLQEVEEHSKNKDPDFIQQYRVKKKNGEIIVVKDRTIVKFDEKGEIEYFYGYIYDMTEQKEMEEYIKQYAFFDQKTGLPNEIKLQEDIESIEGNKMVVQLKINNFKDINTTYGFNIGDDIILVIKDKLIEEFEKLNFKVYKTAQLNFGLLKNCSGIGTNERHETIKGINGIINNFTINSVYGKMHIKITAGAACEKDATFDNALHALYSGYSTGELTIFDKNLERKIKLESEDKINWLKRIREGLSKGYFIPHYQGIRDNNSKEIDKYEALIRYDNGEEFYTPYYFLPIAEEMNLLQDLSKRMINLVIDEMLTHNLNISINLSEKDFLNNKLIKLIEKKLNNNNINPSRLTIEVLENITEEGNKTIIKNIKKLQKIGVRISIDDFGTGHSNFSRLLDISPDFLKIDGSLIKGIVGKDSHKYGNILRSIIDFGHNQGAKLIAEYVEDKETQEKLDILGIDYSQGYYYSKPSRDIMENKK